MFAVDRREKAALWTSIWLVGLLLGASALLTAYRTALYPPERLAEAMAAQTASRSRSFHLVAVTLQRIRTKYVDPGRLDPRRMFLAALQSLQDELAEVILEPSPDGSTVQLRVDVYKKLFHLAAIDSFSALYASLNQALAFVARHIANADRPRKIQYSAISGLLSSLDPHSMLLDPDLYANMKMGTKGSFGGLGIVVSLKMGKLTVVSPIDDTPASRAGIKAGDVIVKIDNEATAGMTLNEAADRLRGAPGSTVVLWVQRRGWPEPKDFRLVRAIIKLKSVTWQLLSSRIGYIRIKQFSQTTARDVAKALEELKRRQARAIILDLYNNPGGLVETAIEVADLFVDRGTIVTTVSEAGRERDSAKASPSKTLWRGTLVVLVNEGSASASEILAGALKGLDRALIVGQKTFGKGSVQVLFDNDDGSALKLTVAQFLSPPRVAIQSHGIVPDVELEPMIADRSRGVHLSANHRVRRERDLARHLSAHWGADQQQPPVLTLQYLEQTDRRSLFRSVGRNAASGAVLEIAAKILLSHLGTDRKQARKRLEAMADDLRALQQQRLVKALAGLGVDWSLAPAADSPLLDTKVEMVPSDGVVSAGDSVTIRITVTNYGRGPAYRVWATTKAMGRLLEARDFVFGRIDPGKSRTWTVKVDIPSYAVGRVEPVTVRFFEEYGHTCPEWNTLLRIRGRRRPLFVVQYHLMDQEFGNGDGLLQPGERANLLITVKNLGAGQALDTVLLLRNRSGANLRLRRARLGLGKLAPGAEAKEMIAIEVPRSASTRTVTLDLKVADNALESSVRSRLVFTLAPPGLMVSRTKQRIKVRTAQAEIRGGADQRSPLLGHLEAGTILSATGKVHGWYRVRLGEDDMGFVAAGDVVDVPITKPVVARMKRHFQITPPILAVKPIPGIIDRDSVRIQATAVDDERIKDMYVEVFSMDRPWQTRKVFYAPNRFAKHQNRMSIETTVPLHPGQNVIRVVARQTAWIQSSRLLVCTRQDR